MDKKLGAAKFLRNFAQAAKCHANFRSAKFVGKFCTVKFSMKIVGFTKFHRGCEFSYVSSAKPLDLPAS